MKTSEVLRQSRDLMRKVGWAQGGSSGDGCLCVVEVLDEAASQDNGAYFSARGAIMAVLGTRNITGWNDAPERTEAEIYDMWDRAIAAAEKDEELSSNGRATA